MSEETTVESLADNDVPSWEEIEAFIEVVNHLVEAIAGAVEAIAEQLVPAARMMGEMMLRLTLYHRLAPLWNKRCWQWITWRIAHKLPLFVLVRLPTRWLSAGVIEPGVKT